MICCWIVGLALVCQSLIWAMATYTQVRFEAAPVEETAAAPVVVKTEPQPPVRSRILTPPPTEEPPPNPAAVEAPAVVPSKHENRMSAAYDLAGGVGRIAVIVLVVVLLAGVAQSGSAAVPGAERAVLALVWGAVLATLVLPLGRTLHLPWEDGALSTYNVMISWVDQIEANNAASVAGGEVDESAPSPLLSHARFLFLPVACIVCVALVGLRFCIAVEAAVMKRESMKLDPVLEREAANISPTSLHGARGASIISRTIKPAPPEPPVPVPMVKADPDEDATMKRLI